MSEFGDLSFLENDKYLIRLLDVLSKNDYRFMSYILLRSRESEVYTRSVCFNQDSYSFTTTNKIYNDTGIYNIVCPCNINLDKLRSNVFDYKINLIGSLKMLYFFRNSLLKDSRYSFTIISFADVNEYPLSLTDLLNNNVEFHPDILLDLLLNHSDKINFHHEFTKVNKGDYHLESLVNFLSVLNNVDKCGNVVLNKYPELHLVLPHVSRLFRIDYNYFTILNNYFTQIYIDVNLDTRQFYYLLSIARDNLSEDSNLDFLMKQMSKYGLKFKMTEDSYDFNSVNNLLSMID